MVYLQFSIAILKFSFIGPIDLIESDTLDKFIRIYFFFSYQKNLPKSKINSKSNLSIKNNMK